MQLKMMLDADSTQVATCNSELGRGNSVQVCVGAAAVVDLALSMRDGSFFV